MNLNKNSRLKFALPVKGRLREPAVELLKRSGYKFRPTGRNLYATCTNAEIIFIFVRADDIPVLVESGTVDLGITGSDLVLERNAKVKEILPLGFGKCKLCVAVKESFRGKNLQQLKGKNVATSFPLITANFFKKKGVKINCLEMNGSVEIMVGLNLAEAIVDLVETGDSLRDNNLKVFEEVGSYQTVLIGNENVINKKEVWQIKKRLEGILVADQYSLLEYNISKKNLKKAEKITPGFDAPTVSFLDQKDLLAVKVMVKKDEVISVMDKLQKIGATAIIENKIRNCRL